jgi:hypothetical protein
MSRKPKAQQTGNRVEQDFNDAIDRLVNGAPRDKSLAKRAKDGSLKINKLAVATEAGHTRTTLDKYPKVVARIEAMGKEPVTTANDVIGRLREDNAKLREQRQAALDVAAAMLIRMRSMEKNTDAEVRKALRRAARPNPNKVVGPTAQVVRFPQDGDDAS